MHSRFQAALTTLAADLQAAIAPMLADPHFPALLEADQVATLQQATGLDEDALAFAHCRLLPPARAPTLSHFNVRGDRPRRQRPLVLWRQYGISRRDHAADRSRRTERHQPRLAARRDLPARYYGELHAVRPIAVSL